MSNSILFQRPLTYTSLADAAYQQLFEAILEGRLPAGSQLSEVALAAELQVSRTPVHEALRRLSADGLVHITSARSARVAEFHRQDVVEIYEMRRLLETAAAERAAIHMPDEQVAELRHAAAAISDHTVDGWSAKALEFDAIFHDRIAATCGNERLCGEVRKYRHLVRALCRLSGSVQTLRAAYDEHLTILQAIGARNPKLAAKHMAAHIASRLASVLHGFPEVKDGATEPEA